MKGQIINKLAVDRDYSFSNDRRTVYLLKYTGNQLEGRNIRKFMEVIYKNFSGLQNTEGLNHTRWEINRLLTSRKSIIIIAIIHGQIVGYLVAENTVLENLRQLMHIAYLFTSPIHRNKGIASCMLNLIQQYAKEQNINTLSLTFDTYNKSLEKFYLDKYFMYDPDLRSYRRYDMLVKYV